VVVVVVVVVVKNVAGNSAAVVDTIVNSVAVVDIAYHKRTMNTTA